MRVLAGTGMTASQMNQHGIAGALLNWWVERRSKRETSARQLHVIETLPLNSKQKLMLVRCAGQQFLIGVGLEQISSIIEVEPVKESIGRNAPCD